MTYRLFLVSCLVSLSTHPQDLLARGQGTPLFGLHENVPLNRVWFVGNQEPEMNEFCLKECQGHARTLTLTLDCPPPVLSHQSRVTRNIFLLVCFLLFSNQWQKNPLFNAKHPFSFRSKMPEKTGSALDTAGSTRRSLLFDFIFGFVVLVARRCGFVVDFQKPFAVKSQV